MSNLLWHHVHVTLADREKAALWHDQYSPAKRISPTIRSEQLYCGPNLLQIQSTAVAPEPRDGGIESIGIGVLNLSKVIAEWESAGGSVDILTNRTAKVHDPWGIPIEFIKSTPEGYTHINIATKSPEQLCDWYEDNLGGTRVPCDWDKTRLALKYDTIFVVFLSVNSTVFSNAKRIIDHLGWYTEDLDTTYSRLSTNNVHFPVIPRKYGPVQLAFAEDPCGNWIELLEPPNGIIKKPT